LANKSFKSGFATIVGRPNVGKSTLLNKLVGEKIAIMSDKPQTTRKQMQCIVTGEDYQIVFIDTPGIHKPRHKLGEFMVNEAESTLPEVDVILFVIECDTKIGPGDEYIINKLKEVKTPVILVINKVDTIKKDEVFKVIEVYKDKLNFKSVIPISALMGDGINLIIDEIKKIVPEGPKYYPDDMITDQTERQVVAEIIREKVLHLIQDEIPHGIAVEILSMKERSNKELMDIEANIYCEKDSHKGILIGKNGSMLKRIGELSRNDIERFLGLKVFLKLWVKVKDDWRNSENMLKNLGYK
jgi:GTP-binding protein Era